ncbi:isoprenylcysteine carboxylmethyltransferase family protein [soil metagenome]
MLNDSKAHTNAVVFPPLIPASGFWLGVLLQKLVPADAWISPTLRGCMRTIGPLLAGLGLVGFAWMVVTMKRAHTPIRNATPPTLLVEKGPFRFTRNPMYLFGSIAYVGLAMRFVQPWSLALLPAVVLATHFGVVLREETVLERRFEGAYRSYKARVRRWV